MEVIALIIAGGIGSRMGQAIPKQFLTVYDKPIIAYTMEKFENHPAIDAIAVVCLDGWEHILESYAKQYKITKLKHIFPAGAVGQESIKNGIMGLAKFYDDDAIVLIHDAIRPNLSKDIISDCIDMTKQYGNAIVCIPCQEAMLETKDKICSESSYPRDNLKRTQTPQGFKLGIIKNAHIKAAELGITNSIASCTLMIEVGEKVFFSMGSEKNIKLTTLEDMEIFKALLDGSK
ncbi:MULTISPECIES: IspD/TarI family cytidylyltransferase [Campylobacter]|uniref:4-diphosphocytidyl-2C-methyl-D-erythritol synthase n=1 Tax=Campylobacter vicugnae TaxID=1660076 RepID=A0A1X9SZG0_9BACT|nr:MULTISPECIES: IspD/TarI family cytidylyltransferase [unclassified Campylobacter]ARR01620.1 4-diphosphocytidyl-2C-methyl-D-erythritol synthase [Campylobacter sp. RM8964]MBQ7135287.1 2-C-methyl-D-erythritol 4-phosphate cytidylyltransferase [Campylobacter sp.]MBQ8820197.1 2-C-methyl-D-erythritol 4-phosphate cytidylyltransferase [Campylobacter sp.]